MRDDKRHPWVLGGLRIPKSLLDRVYAEALESYAKDAESCGLLRGPEGDPGLVDEIVVMENRAAKLHALDPETYPRTARMYFDIDPLKFSRLVEAGEKDGRPVKILYHSHLDAFSAAEGSGAYFSETDAQAATMNGEPTFDLAYLVTSVRKGAIETHALFIWDPGTRTFVPSPLDVIDA
jgi:proteasome lid subunit RPN8/RPN11